MIHHGSVYLLPLHRQEPRQAHCFATFFCYNIPVANFRSNITMKTHRWLHKRGEVYYLRAIVPQELAAFVGKVEIWRSLRTSRKQEAMQRIKLAAKDVERWFEQARQHRNSVLASLKPRRGKALRETGFASAADALQHDLMIIRKKYGDPQAVDLTIVQPFYESLRALAETFPEVRVSDVLAAIEAEQKKREPRVQSSKFIPRIVPPEEKTD
jgi:hypothetical protein